MLYERWRQIARENRGEMALHDLASGERWTFAQLATAAEQGDVARPVAHPQGREFVLTLLRAWRDGVVVCPLEAGQTPPVLDALSPGCIHLKTTSATTGAPRVVAFTAEQLAADAENIVATMGLRRDWPNLGVISLAHSYGFSNLILPLLLHGIPLVLVDAPLPEAVRQAADGLPGITLPAVPALWRAWHAAGAIPRNVRLAISAGAPLSLALEQAVFAASGLKIHNFYGSSECGGIAYDADAAPRTDESCVGAPMKNVRVEIAEDGCLEVLSGAVGETYWPENHANLNGGRFRTSDLAEVRDGRIFWRGRAGDQINVAGRKVSPDIIERALLGHPGVAACLVFGAPSADRERGETVVACVAAKKPMTGETLRQFLLGTLPAWQVPREWMFVDSLEADERGKISRAEWRRRFLATRK
jgi:long-chain acyl-CoA synthetase